MKMKNKISISTVIRLLLIIAMLSIPFLINAQDPNDPGGGGGDPGAPIDGGLTILLATGIGYGIKKYRDGKKKNDGEEKELE
jgi:hypothetical protein